MPALEWSTQQLAEFLVSVSRCEDEGSAALVAVERTAEALDAEVAAIVHEGRLVTVVGYPEGTAPLADLVAVAPGVTGRELTIPGVGSCPAVGVSLEYPPGATLVVARSAHDGLSHEEARLLRGIARVTSMTLQMFRVLDAERAARQEADHQATENARLLESLTERQALVERLAEEQAALRRVATLVAGQAAADDTFTAVAHEACHLLRAECGAICRFELDGSMTIMSSSLAGGELVPGGTRIGLEEGVAAMVQQSGAPARVDSYEGLTGPAAELANRTGLTSSVASPIVVEGRLWGAMVVMDRQPLPPDAEDRMVKFAELIATAIGNAESRAQLAASRARVIATADETRRRIERDLHDGTQQRLVSLGLELRAVEASVPPELEVLRAQMSRVARGLAEVVEDLQEISRGIHPAILSKGGLGPAIKMLARRSSVPVELDLHAEGRLPEAIEVAAYFFVSEALTNVAKHAQASVVHIAVKADGTAAELWVRDDGVGGADSSRGSGLIGLRDRAEALGGTMDITSVTGAGTSLHVHLPIDAS